MRTKVLLVVVALLMAIVSTVAIGSNMGFKISIPLTAGSNSFVSVPFYNSYTDAASLRTDINAAIAPATATVFRWNGTVWQRWAGGGGGQTNFAVSPGEAYQVLPTGSGNWVVVGSHNPSLALSFTAGTNAFVSVPYHTTAVTASDLRTQINAAIAPATVTLFNWNGTVWQRWAGGGGGQTNFTITPGVGVQVLPTGTGSWTPAHY